MHYAYPLMPGVRAFMPPQGILLVAAHLPKEWEVRFVDENIRPARDGDFRWADAVVLSGMHVQRAHILDLAGRARAFGRITILGGPSASACPEWYTDIDILHVGELGDATDRIIQRLDGSCARPARQEIFTTVERLPLTSFPVPAYHLLDLDDYFLGSVQFSSGCPYQCEFCDIPELYGRKARLKSPRQVTAELDAMLARGNPGAVYFVDDNFIANPKAAVELLGELVEWQKRRGYPVEFACEATLNIAQMPKALELMREAYFGTVFCGIETPDEAGLEFMHKEQNLRKPILESIRVLNSYGLEVVSGIILGLDTDKEGSGEAISAFVEESQIPMLTINILHALPKTPLWRRLEADHRLLRGGGGRESNVQFLLPYETVVGMWLKCVERAYAPDAIYRRFDHQIAHTFPNRKHLPVTRARVNAKNILKGISILGRIFWHVGIRADYRRRFWQTAWPNLKQGKIEELIHAAVVAHHLIKFARDCADGSAEKCFYGEAPRSARVAPLA